MPVQLQHIDGTERWAVTKRAGSYLEHFPPERLVYLSSDSSTLLTSLEPGTAYVTNPYPYPYPYPNPYPYPSPPRWRGGGRCSQRAAC